MMRLEAGFLLFLLVSCSSEPPPPKSPPPAAVAHGDHSPHHGGVVLMHGDLHFEVLLDPDGTHRIFLTDAVRNELPAAAASEVTVTVVRPGGVEPEKLLLDIDEFGESWIARGQPVVEEESRAIVALVHEGERYEIELPFLAVPVDPGAADPHQTHPP
jgi:hypothetical protein